jgi:hypothetical protein
MIDVKKERIKELITLAFTRPISFEEYIARVTYLAKSALLKTMFMRLRSNTIKLTHQRDLVDEGRWDILIVLDACRYDAFKQLVFKFLDGVLIPVFSNSSITLDWFINTWCNFKHKSHVYYISANPFIRKGDPSVGKCVRKIIDAWKLFWIKEKMTVDEKSVLNFSKVMLRMRLKDLKNGQFKLVIHLLQPHAPYIYWPKAFDELWKLGAPYNITTIFSFYRSNKQLTNVLKASYIKSLSHTLKNIAEFVHEVHRQYSQKIRIAITSDHGELFGEYGLLFHPNIDVPELRIVPWFIIR